MPTIGENCQQLGIALIRNNSWWLETSSCLQKRWYLSSSPTCFSGKIVIFFCEALSAVPLCLARLGSPNSTNSTETWKPWISRCILHPWYQVQVSLQKKTWRCHHFHIISCENFCEMLWEGQHIYKSRWPFAGQERASHTFSPLVFCENRGGFDFHTDREGSAKNINKCHIDEIWVHPNALFSISHFFLFGDRKPDSRFTSLPKEQVTKGAELQAVSSIARGFAAWRQSADRKSVV